MRRKDVFYVTGGVLLWLFTSIAAGSLCWFQAVIGFPCPGCGTTRAAVDLLNGRFAQAHVWHPLITVTYILIPYLAVRVVFLHRFAMYKAEKYLLLLLTFLYLAVYIVRMVLLFPHTQPLIPHADAIWRQVLGYIRTVITGS